MATTPVEFNQPIEQAPPQRQDSDSESNIKLAKRLMAEGSAARAKFDGDWDKRWSYYYGDQWSSERTSLYRSKPVQNIIRSTIQAQLPILTDQRPGFTVLPRDPSDWQFAEILGELIEPYWDDHGLDHVIIEVLMDMMVLDAGILKVSWDSDMDQEDGNVRVECVDPNDIFVPYGAADFTKNCPWVIHRSHKPVGELKKLFSKMADQIKSDSRQDDSKARYTDDIKLVSPTDQYSPPGMGGNPVSQSDQRQTAEVWEVWMDSDEVIEEELESGEKVTKKKYPHGKLLTILPNQSLELQCVDSPYRHGRKPFVRFVDHILPRSFWGEGETKQLLQQQRMLNRSLAHLFDVVNLLSNPVWVVESDSGVRPDQITNQVASVLMTAPNGSSKVKRDFPPALQSGITDLVQFIQGMVSEASGITEVSQGRKPPGVTAAAALETLQEAANTRIRLKERNMQVSLQQLGYQVIGLMLQYYNEPRVVRLTGKDQGWPRYVEFFIDDYSENGGGYVMNHKEYDYSPETAQYLPQTEYTQTPETKGLMDVKVLSGTAMPWQKTSRANIAFRLFDMKAIDTEELLKALEWPNAERVAERLSMQPEAGPEGAPPPAAPPGIPQAGGG